MMKRVINERNLNIVLFQELKIHHDNVNAIDIDWKEEFKNWKVVIDNNETGILINKIVAMSKFETKAKMKGNQWMTRVIIHYKGKRIALASYYRSPSKRKENENSNKKQADVRKIQEEITMWKRKQKVHSIIIGGDFNMHSKLWDKYGKDKRADRKHVENLIKLMDEIT